MKVKLGPVDRNPLVVRIEPAGVDHVVAAGDYVVYEWPDRDEFPRPMPMVGTGSQGILVVRWTEGGDRLWTSDGQYLPIHPLLDDSGPYAGPWCVGCCLPREDLEIVAPAVFDRSQTMVSDTPCPHCGATELEWADDQSPLITERD